MADEPSQSSPPTSHLDDDAPASTDDAQPPSDLEDFFRDVEPTIRDAEAHLGVPHGTLGDIRNDTDFLAIVKIHATIEPLLNEAIRENLTRALSHPKVSFPAGDAVAEFVLGGRLESKIRLALEAEIISDDNARFIRAVAKLRNHYAHNVGNFAQRIDEAAAIIDKQTEGFNIQRDLLSYSDDLKKGSVSKIAFILLRPFLFLRFANLLSTLMKGIRPPPPMSQALGDLFRGAGTVGRLKSSDDKGDV
jgi:hypothetical protein